MTKDDCYFLGKITRTVGYKGEIQLFLDVDNPEEYAQLESFFIDLGGSLIPFFVQELKMKGNKPTVKLQDIDSEEQASLLVNKLLYLPLDLLPQLTGNRFYFHEVINFKVVDKNQGEIGYIEKVLDMPRQALLQIQFKGKEVLLPIADEIILSVNRETQTMHVEAPEGLLEIYLDE